MPMPAHRGIPRCDRCRLKNLKCDRNLPICNHCSEDVDAVECIYTPKKRKPPKSPSLDSILNLPVTSDPCDPAPEYVRGQAATAGADPHEEQTRTSESATPVSQNMWDFDEDCESEGGSSERRSSDRRPSCDPPAPLGSPVLPPPHYIPCTPSVHVSPLINNPTGHLANNVKDDITEQPTIASSPPDPDPATKTPETLDPGPTQTNISISSKFWARILRLMVRRNATQQQYNTERLSNIEMHTVAPGRGRVLICGEPVTETEEMPLSYSMIPFTPRAPSMNSQASGILDASRSEEKLGLWYYICYCKCL
ncbi:hypothetical protein BJ138DRAFT_1167052 [Hygrophoropsis aurantiaca]|uniref:Uncharacterized protein n=1 Tax=Hygrophoropsis aurantiaca TaxID=72124 RepID=A0ACB7ZTU2_9AGAM|nr:hypothetical protein BJ138DRAFT_1167052 [Hygrophoropsis aurantiaca]